MSVSKKPNESELDYIRQFFKYNPMTGELHNFHMQHRKWYLIVPRLRYWNGRARYPCSRVRGRRIRVTNICWYLHYNEWPEKEVDHIDRDPTNNVITNLRLANSALQKINRNLNRKYLPGVAMYQNWRKKPYWAGIKHQGKHYYLGVYHSELEAHQAYRAKYEELYGEPLELEAP